VDYGSPAPREMSFRLLGLPSGDAQRMRLSLFLAALLTWGYDLFSLALHVR
jgi:hypothetical protein